MREGAIRALRTHPQFRGAPASASRIIVTHDALISGVGTTLHRLPISPERVDAGDDLLIRVAGAPDYLGGLVGQDAEHFYLTAIHGWSHANPYDGGSEGTSKYELWSATKDGRNATRIEGDLATQQAVSADANGVYWGASLGITYDVRALRADGGVRTIAALSGRFARINAITASDNCIYVATGNGITPEGTLELRSAPSRE
jgi:hypothetical protein